MQSHTMELPRLIEIGEKNIGDFGKFVNSYCCTHKNFFDIHPPHRVSPTRQCQSFGGIVRDDRDWGDGLLLQCDGVSCREPARGLAGVIGCGLGE